MRFGPFIVTYFFWFFLPSFHVPRVLDGNIKKNTSKFYKNSEKKKPGGLVTLVSAEFLHSCTFKL